jgi:hypothetical protein
MSDPKDATLKEIEAGKQPKIDLTAAAMLAAMPALRVVTSATTPAAQPDRRIFPDGPEPDRLYGYVTFVDEATGEKRLPRSPDDPSVVVGYPTYIALEFVNPAGEVRVLQVGAAGRGFALGSASGPTGGSSATAWYYDVQMLPDTSEGAPREGAPVGYVPRPGRTVAVSYNPDQWRFLRLSLGPLIPRPGSGEGWVYFTERGQTFPDLPNTP